MAGRDELGRESRGLVGGDEPEMPRTISIKPKSQNSIFKEEKD